MLLWQKAAARNSMQGVCGQTLRGIVMPSYYSSSDFDDSAYDLRARAIRARLYACLLGPHDEASGRLIALADDLEARADAEECAPIVPFLVLA